MLASAVLLQTALFGRTAALLRVVDVAEDLARRGWDVARVAGGRWPALVATRRAPGRDVVAITLAAPGYQAKRTFLLVRSFVPRSASSLDATWILRTRSSCETARPRDYARVDLVTLTLSDVAPSVPSLDATPRVAVLRWWTGAPVPVMTLHEDLAAAEAQVASEFHDEGYRGPASA